MTGGSPGRSPPLRAPGWPGSGIRDLRWPGSGYGSPPGRAGGHGPPAGQRPGSRAPPAGAAGGRSPGPSGRRGRRPPHGSRAVGQAGGRPPGAEPYPGSARQATGHPGHGRGRGAVRRPGAGLDIAPAAARADRAGVPAGLGERAVPGGRRADDRQSEGRGRRARGRLPAAGRGRPRTRHRHHQPARQHGHRHLQCLGQPGPGRAAVGLPGPLHAAQDGRGLEGRLESRGHRPRSARRASAWPS